MSEYQQGKISAIFSVGSKIEDLSESFEKESISLEAYKNAYTVVVKTLDSYKTNVSNDAQAGKVNLKDAEYAKIYISKCIEVVLQLYNDNETKRNRSSGAADSLKQAVSIIKRYYDEEKNKLESANSVSSEDTQSTEEKEDQTDYKNRPVGTSPGSPLEEYKKSIDDNSEVLDDLAPNLTTEKKSKRKQTLQKS